MNSLDFSKFCLWDSEQINIDSSSLDKYIIDMTKEYPPIDFLLSYNGVGCVPKGDLQAVTGKLKAGKTFACICIEVAMLKGEHMGIKSLKDDIKILHVDTEQSSGNIVDRASILHSLCGWAEKENNDRFNVITLRECDYTKRISIIEQAIEKFNPDFMLIDGVRDLCADFNDIKESSLLIGDLMRFCNEYEIAIMCVLHENKNDSNMRGHLGTELGNKCSEVYKISKNENTGVILVEQTVSRNEPIDKWSFSINDEGVPQVESVANVNVKTQRRNEVLQTLFKKKGVYSYTELVNDYKPLLGCAERTAKLHIANALKENVLFQNGSSYSYIFPSDEDDILS